MQKIVYKFNGQVYDNPHAVRRAIGAGEQKLAFGKCETAEDWLKYGVSVESIDVEVKATEQTDEQLASSARERRNRMLRESDFMVLPDAPCTEKERAEITAYRQQLRDITRQEDWPKIINWPQIPDVLHGVVYA